MSNLDSTNLSGGHGGQGSLATIFSRLVSGHKPLKLANADRTYGAVAQAMKQGIDPLTDQPDEQENPYVPAGYTYLGQLIDHDLTFDTKSKLGVDKTRPNNERTPVLDLDCLYGLGPNSAPFMYDSDGKLLAHSNGYDLLRSDNGRAIIGDPRNDENSIVCQLQLALVNFHNAMIDHFKGPHHNLKGNHLFDAARKEVTWTYQRIVKEDYLKRIVREGVYSTFMNKFDSEVPTSAFATGLGTLTALKSGLPLEFTAAAYRYGHSMIRNGYRLNSFYQTKIFDGTNNSHLSLVGFGPLPESHSINWKLFFPQSKGEEAQLPGQKAANHVSGKDRLQFAYKIDTTLVDPLAMLPPKIIGNDAAVGGVATAKSSLIGRNLLRAYGFELCSGQDVAKALGIAALPPAALAVGEDFSSLADAAIPPETEPDATSRKDGPALLAQTPLWIYVLAEGQHEVALMRAKHKNDPKKIKADMPTTGTQLGAVGGQILLEVFCGILHEDKSSYIHHKSWKPVVGGETVWDLLQFARLI